MIKLLHWFANRRRPDIIEPFAMCWHLVKLFGFQVNLSLTFRDDDEDDFRPLECESWSVVLLGSYLARHMSVDGRRQWLDQVDTYGYRHYPRNTMFNIELPPARDFDEAMIRFHWMNVPEFVFGARKPLWMLVVSRG